MRHSVHTNQTPSRPPCNPSGVTETTTVWGERQTACTTEQRWNCGRGTVENIIRMKLKKRGNPEKPPPKNPDIFHDNWHLYDTEARTRFPSMDRRVVYGTATNADCTSIRCWAWCLSYIEVRKLVTRLDVLKFDIIWRFTFWTTALNYETVRTLLKSTQCTLQYSI